MASYLNMKNEFEGSIALKVQLSELNQDIPPN